MFNDILSNFEYKEKEIENSINSLKLELINYKDSFIPKIKKHFVLNSFDKVSDLIKFLGYDRFFVVFEFVLKKRILSKEEIFNKDILDFIFINNKIFSEKNNQKLLLSSFDNLDYSNKVKFCLNYSSGGNNSNNFYFCQEFLKNELFVYQNFGRFNQLYIDGFYFDQNCPALTLSFVKDSQEHIHDFAKSLTTIFNNGYPSKLIQIFEHTLSEFECYVVKVEDGRVFIPIKYSDDLFSSSTGDLFTDFVNVLNFISKKLWYQE